MIVKKAVIPAAGLGTRVLPASKAIPTEMLPIVDLPAIYYLVEEAVQSGIREILVITNRDKDAMEDFFDDGTFFASADLLYGGSGHRNSTSGNRTHRKYRNY